MGMPEQPQNGMNIAPDGTIYEILEDGTIKRIGKVSPDGSFEPFGGPKDGIRVKNGFIYRVINGKEKKIGRILPNGEIETINQRIRSEAEISRNKVKIVTILSIIIALVIGAGLYIFDEQQQTKEELRKADEERRLEKEKEEEYENKIRPVYAEYLEEKSPTSEKLGSYITQLNNIMKLGLRHEDNKKKLHEIMGEIEKKKIAIKAEEKRLADEKAHKLVLEKAKKTEYDNKIKPLYDDGYLKEKSPTSGKLQSYIDKLNKLSTSLQYDVNKTKLTEIVEIIKDRKNEVQKAEEKRAEVARKKREAERIEAEKREQYLKGRKIGNLIWSDRASETMNWSSAKQYCEELTEGGFTDWRLPKISELRRIIKNCSSQSGGSCRVSDNCLSSDCNGSCCCDDNKGSYYSKFATTDILWSSSTVSDDAKSVWTVMFLDEDISISRKGVHLHSLYKSSNLVVRCVRDAK
mgnify:CR=1 FL=1